MELPYTQQMAKHKIKDEGKKLKDTFLKFFIVLLYMGEDVCV